MQRLFLTTLFFSLTLSACSGWTVAPQPLPIYTPFPTRTPFIFTATPILLPLPATGTFTPTFVVTPNDQTLSPTLTFTLAAAPTETPTGTPSPTFTPSPAMLVDIVACNTSLDITHGMGEVTNAYPEIRNTGGVELTNVCATLRGLDEAREHPDKHKCVPSLPVGYRITFLLTVDTAYNQDTAVQVEVSTDQGIASRVGKDSCKAIGIPWVNPPALDVAQPIP